MTPSNAGNAPWCFPWGHVADDRERERRVRLTALKEEVERRAQRGEDKEYLARYIEGRLSMIFPDLALLGGGEQDQTVGGRAPQLEVQGLHRRDIVSLGTERMTVGKHPDNDLVIREDSSVARVHAVLERVGDRWSIHDTGSTNGTVVNGTLIVGEHVLRDDDEIIVGRTRLRFCERPSAGPSPTGAMDQRPSLTPAERRVLIEVCRRPETPPTVREIAQRLFVGDAVVKRQLSSLYDKFGINDDGSSLPRRVRLARAAIDGEWDEGSGDREPRHPVPPKQGPGTARPLPET